MRGWWLELGRMVLPVDCAGCGAAREPVCAECTRALLPGRTGARRVHRADAPAGLPPVYAAAEYGDSVRAVLLAHKERGALPLARPLGRALALAAQQALAGMPVRPVRLVPVPSARAAVARRGHDPVRRIALAAAAVLRRAGWPVLVDGLLRPRRAVADQAGLDARGRRANLAGALVAAPGRRARADWPVLLVDDLITTGASLAEAARAVRAALPGSADGVLGAAVVAAVPAPTGRTGW